MVFINAAFEPIQTPRAEPNNKADSAPSNTLIFISGLFVIQVIGMHNITKRTSRQREEINAMTADEFPEIDKLVNVINWGIRQNTMRSIWPDGFPHPGLEERNVIKTNELFLYVIRYLMYHEAAHLMLHYTSLELIVKVNNKLELNSDEKRRVRIMEIQADDFAFDSVVLSKGEKSRCFI